MMPRIYLLSAACLAALLTGCVTTPDFEMSPEQKSVIPSQWNAPALNPHLSQDTADWWSSWEEAELSDLISRAMSANTSVKEAQANLRYAMAGLTVSGSNLVPKVNGTGSGGRSHSKRTGANSFSIGVNGSWTIDAGGNYADYLASKADLMSADASLGDVQTAIAAQVAAAYVNLRLAQRQVSVAEQNLKTQKEALDIADWRYRSGLVDSTDVDQARTSLEQTRASIPSHKANVVRNRNLLAKLTSQKPESTGILPVKQIPVPPNNLSLSIPADTLRHRPDVRAAEADVMAAMARHTSARSALFPSLTINGSLGLAGVTVGMLGDPGTHNSSILGSINLPIFNAGALRAQVEQRDAQVQAANARYEAALLTGIQEIEDALNDIWAVQQRIKSLQVAVESAKRAATNARQNYQAGLQDFTVVLTTQRTLLTVEEQLAQTEANLSLSFIDLYNALGGGWKSSLNQKEENDVRK